MMKNIINFFKKIFHKNETTISINDAIDDCIPFEWDDPVEFESDNLETKDAVLVKKRSC